MARTAIPITALAANAGVNTGAGTAVDVANGHAIAAASETDRLLLRVTNTSGSIRVVTVKAGSRFRAGVGDLTVSVPATTGDMLIGPLESARFVQADGGVDVDLAAGHTGAVWAFRLPKA
jgi:hypothetical protein